MLAPLARSKRLPGDGLRSAEEALALKDKALVFDLIVSDLEMPGMDGIAFAERLKEDAVGQDPADRAFLLRLARA